MPCGPQVVPSGAEKVPLLGVNRPKGLPPFLAARVALVRTRLLLALSPTRSGTTNVQVTVGPCVICLDPGQHASYLSLPRTLLTASPRRCSM